MSNKYNLFDFISEDKNNENAQSIIFSDKIFDEINIPKLFSQIKKCKKLKDLKYYQLSEITSQLDKNIREVFINYISLVCKGFNFYKKNLEKNLLNISGYSVLCRRCKGEKLETIGVEKNISRERVRQIEKASIDQMYIYISTFLQVKNNEGIFANNIFYNYNEIFNFIKNKELIEIIIYTIKKVNDAIYSKFDIEFNSFINVKKINMINKIKNMIKLDNSFNYYEEYTAINNKLTFNHNILDFTFDIYKNYLIYKKYTLKDNTAAIQEQLSSNMMVSKVIMKYFPNGILLDNEGHEKLRKTILKEYDCEVNVSSTMSNIDETNPELIVWGKKVRIHIDNVHIKEKKINEIINEFENHFKDYQYQLLEDIYNKINDSLINTVITDKYKLYGILKYYLKEKYYFKKMAVRSISQKNEKIKDLVKEYIDLHNMCTIEEIVDALDIATPTAYAVIRDNPLIVCIDSKYTLATKLNITKEDLDHIKILLTNDVNNEYIHKDNFYNQHLSEWKKIRITDESMLYHICKYYFSDSFNFFVPYIQDKKYDYAITFKKIMNDYLKANNGIIDISKAQKDLSYIISSKDFSLIYLLRSFDFKVFRMEEDRLTTGDNIYVDDITKYMINQRIDEYFKDNSNKKIILEKDINKLSKGLYYYVNDEKCYMNYYSLCSYLENYSKDYYVICSLGINNYINSKYAITKENITYVEMVYREIRKLFPNKENSKIEINKAIRNNNLLVTFPNNLFKDYAEYNEDKIIFKN